MSNILGYPVITIRDAQTGDVRKTIELKNTQSIFIESMFSPEHINYADNKDFNALNMSTMNSVKICYMPFQKEKIKRFPGGSDDSSNPSDRFKIDGEDKYVSVIDMDSNSGRTHDITIDNNGRPTLKIQGSIPAPVGGVRNIGTVGVIKHGYSRMNGYSSGGGLLFYTPLDEIVTQDETMIIDITYTIIVNASFNNLENDAGLITSFFSMIDRGHDKMKELGYPAEIIKADRSHYNRFGFSPIRYAKPFDKDKYNGMTAYTKLTTATVSSGPAAGATCPVLQSRSYSVNYSSLDACGEFVGSMNSLVHPTERMMADKTGSTSLRNVDSGLKTSVLYEKHRDGNEQLLPFLDSSKFKQGSGSIKVVSAEDEKGLPERWTIDVVEGGGPAVAKFKVRKTYTTGYTNNKITQYASAVPHLSSRTLGTIPFSQFKCEDAEWYSFAGLLIPVYDNNILNVSRKGVMVTGIRNSDYKLFNKTNLTPNSGDISVVGVAYSFEEKNFFVGCHKNGLYKVTANIEGTAAPTVEKVAGINKVYAINTNGHGGITVLTNDKLKISKDNGKTWTDIALSEVYSTTGLKDEQDAMSLSALTTDYDSATLNTFMLKGIRSDNAGKRVGWISTANKKGDWADMVGKNSMNIQTFVYDEKSTTKLKALLKSRSSIDSETPRWWDALLTPPQLGAVFAGGKLHISHSNDYDTSTKSEFVSVLDFKANMSSIEDGKANAPWVKPYIMVGSNKDSTNYISLRNTSFNISSSYGDDKFQNHDYYCFDLDVYSYRNGNKDEMQTLPVATGNNVGRSFGYSITNGDIQIIQMKESVATASKEQNQSLVFADIKPLRENVTTYFAGSITHQTDYTKDIAIEFKHNNQATFNLNNVTLDGVTLGVESAGEFKVGDSYEFYRFGGYINDNISTAQIDYEVSSSELSEEVTQNGIVSTEEPLAKVKVPFILNGDGHITNNGFLKSDYKSSGASSGPEFEACVYGDFRLNLSMEKLRGVSYVEIIFGEKDWNSSSGNRATLYLCNTNNKKFYAHFATSSSSHRKDIRLSPAHPTQYSLDGKNDLNLEFNALTRTVRFLSGSTQLATFGAAPNNTVPYCKIRFGLAYHSVEPNGSVYISQTIDEDLVASSRVLDTEKSCVKTPEFAYSNKKVLCTIIGDKTNSKGYYDPKFIGLPFVYGDNISVTVNNKPAKVTIIPARTTNDSFRHETGILAASESATGSYDSRLKAGEVLIDPTTCIVLFSPDDKGKPYSIKYRYFKDTHWGIDEVASE